MHLFFAYRSVSGVEIPASRLIEGSVEETQAIVEALFRESVTPLGVMYDTSTPEKRDELFTRFCRLYANTPLSETGLRHSLRWTMRDLLADITL